jgi:hypothetical protein
VARYDTAVPGLNVLLRDLRKLPKEAQAELRTASQEIADRHMVPAWRAAALQAGPWGPRIAASVRSRRDRVPVVVIGGNRRVFSGGASATMARYPSDKGDRARAARGVVNRMPAAFGSGADWIETVRAKYARQAMGEWAAAVSRVVRDFNNGRWG